jgi:hypothetical protein
MWDGETERELCGPDPRGCEGQIGSSCGVSDDCEDGVCCLSGECGGGTCTYLCANDADCPPRTLCDGGFCFFACNANTDCGPGQECREDQTICQY